MAIHSAALTFGHVPPAFLDWIWKDVVRLLDKPVRRGGNDWSEVEKSLQDGRSQLWVTMADKPVAAAVSRMDGDTFEIWLAGGAILSTSLPFLERAIEAAMLDGATNGRIIGRKGWERVLEPYGWHREGDELTKDFTR